MGAIGNSQIWQRRSCGWSISRHRRLIVLLLTAASLLAAGLSNWKSRSGEPGYRGLSSLLPTLSPSMTQIKKPEGVKVIGFVFYGRPRYVNILDCYLKRNLVLNGGHLDEVHWMVNTMEPLDIEWLDDLIATEPLYKKFDMHHDKGSYDSIWTYANDTNAIYIKIDDDTVYMHDNAIPRMVQTLINHPEAFAVAANIVNSPLTNWLHYHGGAIYPYVPDDSPPVSQGNATTWRPSELPQYKGWLDGEWPLRDKPPGQEHFRIGDEGGPPHQNHRWLPLENTPMNLAKTPIATGAEYDPFGMALYHWTLAAQQHYSLFDHLENNNFSGYHVGNGDGIWNMQYTRYNLNFCAISGKHVLMEPIGGDDEGDITENIPKKLKMPLLVDTHAIIAHFSYNPTPELLGTDLLSRYLAYANEKVCTPNNQRVVLDPKFYPELESSP